MTPSVEAEDALWFVVLALNTWLAVLLVRNRLLRDAIDLYQLSSVLSPNAIAGIFQKSPALFFPMPPRFFM